MPVLKGLIESLRSACESADLLVEAPKATPKQASYAHTMAKENPATWTALAGGLGLSPAPTLDDFLQMDKKTISKVISDLKKNQLASRKQVGFLLSLLMNVSKDDYKHWGYDKVIGRPTAANLKKLSMTHASSLINNLMGIN